MLVDNQSNSTANSGARRFFAFLCICRFFLWCLRSGCLLSCRFLRFCRCLCCRCLCFCRCLLCRCLCSCRCLCCWCLCFCRCLRSCRCLRICRCFAIRILCSLPRGGFCFCLGFFRLALCSCWWLYIRRWLCICSLSLCCVCRCFAVWIFCSFTLGISRSCFRGLRVCV